MAKNHCGSNNSSSPKNSSSVGRKEDLSLHRALLGLQIFFFFKSGSHEAQADLKCLYRKEWSSLVPSSRVDHHTRLMKCCGQNPGPPVGQALQQQNHVLGPVLSYFLLFPDLLHEPITEKIVSFEFIQIHSVDNAYHVLSFINEQTNPKASNYNPDDGKEKETKEKG